MPSRYPDLDPRLRIISVSASLYVYAPSDVRRADETIRMGCMPEGVPYEGQFTRAVLDDLVKEAAVPDIDSLNRLTNTVWMHVAVAGSGMFRGEYLYGISLKEDSKIYCCSLDMDALFPQLRW